MIPSRRRQRISAGAEGLCDDIRGSGQSVCLNNRPLQPMCIIQVGGIFGASAKSIKRQWAVSLSSDMTTPVRWYADWLLISLGHMLIFYFEIFPRSLIR
jgi:hypothetical protein